MSVPVAWGGGLGEWESGMETKVNPLASALAQLIGDKTERLRMGKEGQRYSRSKFSESVMYMRCSEIFGIGQVLTEVDLVGTR